MAEEYEARVQLFDGEDVGEILYGTWLTNPWGLDERCFCVELDSGQSLHIWMKGLTDTGSMLGPSRPKPRRLVIK